MICPYCKSENTDYVDSDNNSTKYKCCDCGEDFIELDNGEITTRNGKPLKNNVKEKIKYDKYDKNTNY